MISSNTIILCTVCRCFAAFWACLCPIFKYCSFAIFQLVYLNHGGENITAYSAFDNKSHTLFFFLSLSLLFLAFYHYAMALGDLVESVGGVGEGLSNLSDIILYISNSWLDNGLTFFIASSKCRMCILSSLA